MEREEYECKMCENYMTEQEYELCDICRECGEGETDNINTGYTLKTKVMKIINSSNNKGRIHQIVEFNDKKFKIIAALENGSTTLEARIMNSDGVFDFILSYNDLNYDFNGASYVSSQNIKDAALNEGLDKMKALIKKIYKIEVPEAEITPEELIANCRDTNEEHSWVVSERCNTGKWSEAECDKCGLRKSNS